MDNNAFRTLVNQKVKSTKEIAREAVETEFRQKAQKRGGGGGRRSRGGDYDSDSASDNDNDNLTKRRRDDNKRKSDEGKDEPEWKRRRKEKGAASSTTGYRDRAKERREGKNLDYSDTVATTIHNTNGDEYIDRKRQAELSKFLGGDEEHTHLVKGLDMALAQKVRREEMGGADDEEERVEEDLDQLLENAYTTRQENLSSTSKKSLIAMIQPKSELGKSVQNYLLQLQKRHRHDNPTTTAATISNTKQHSIQINPTKQNAIQRSHYTFSLDSTIQKRGNAWDLPQLQMVGGVSGQHHHQSSFSERKSMTPLDGHLIATIRKKLDGTLNNSGGGGGGERKVMNDNEMERVVDKHDSGVKQQQQPSSSPDKVDDSNKPSHDENNSNHKTLAPPLDNNKKDDSDFDSDDDIFANVGAYVPPTAVAQSGDTVMPSAAATASAQTNDGDDDVATPPSAATTSKKHSSIFDNLITDQSSNDVNASQKRQPMQLPHTQQPMQHQNIQSLNSQNKNLIDRDVFGGNRKQDKQQHSQANKRRGPQTAAMEGVSMTNYQGGYGEEMDTDFLNEDGEDGYQKLKRRSDDDDDDGGVGEDKTVDAIDDEED